MKYTPTAIRDIINFLLTKFNIHNERFVEDMIGQFNFSEKTIENWIDGKVTPAKTGRKRLAEYFRAYNPKFNPSDFLLGAGDFKVKFNELYQKESISTFNIPLNGVNLSIAELGNEYKKLRGIYRTYRYAFENTGKVAKEFLIIKGYDESSHLIKAVIIGGSNTMRGAIGSYSSRNLKIEEFQGRVLCIGNTYYMFFTSEAKQNHNNIRMRLVILEKSEHHLSYENFHYGVMTARSSYFGAPVSVRIFLEKIPKALDKNISIQQLKKDVEITTQDKIPQSILNLISNDIKKEHMGVREDYVLRTSANDMMEILRP